MSKIIHTIALLYFVLLSSGITIFAQDSGIEGSVIMWDERKLRWGDFLGMVPANSEYDALTNSAISIAYQGDNTSLTITIESIFDLEGSWKKPEVSDYLLSHEQLHFDITEYYSRLLRKKLKAHKFKSFASIEGDIQSLFTKAYGDAKKMQEKYDKQTDHSVNKKKQAKWNAKIKKLLAGTSIYKKTEFKVDLTYVTK